MICGVQARRDCPGAREVADRTSGVSGNAFADHERRRRQQVSLVGRPSTPLEHQPIGIILSKRCLLDCERPDGFVWLFTFLKLGAYRVYANVIALNVPEFFVENALDL